MTFQIALVCDNCHRLLGVAPSESAAIQDAARRGAAEAWLIGDPPRSFCDEACYGAFSVGRVHWDDSGAKAPQRRRLDGTRLQQALTAYEQGGIGAVMEKEQIGERQAWRLVSKAKAEQQP